MTMHAMSAIYKCIRLQHIQTLFAYNGMKYVICVCVNMYICMYMYIHTYIHVHVCIYKLSITYRNIPCNATSFKRNLKVKVVFYQHLTCYLKISKLHLSNAMLTADQLLYYKFKTDIKLLFSLVLNTVLNWQKLKCWGELLHFYVMMWEFSLAYSKD